MISQRYKIAEERRQKVLDYLVDGEPRTAVEMATALSEKLKTIQSTLRAMVRLGEVECDGGPRGRVKFKGLSRVTSTAEVQYESTRVKPEDGNKFGRAHKLRQAREKRPGVHTPDMPIPNQGGQGNVRTYGRRVNQDTM